MAIDNQKLIKVLRETELVKQEQLQKAQKKSEEDGIPLEQVLVDEEYISDDHLGQIMADIFGVPFISLKKKSIDETLSLIHISEPTRPL